MLPVVLHFCTQAVHSGTYYDITVIMIMIKIIVKNNNNDIFTIPQASPFLALKKSLKCFKMSQGTTLGVSNCHHAWLNGIKNKSGAIFDLL